MLAGGCGFAFTNPLPPGAWVSSGVVPSLGLVSSRVNIRAC